MSNFFVVEAVQKAKAVRIPGAKKEGVKCFDKVKASTLNKLDISIMEFVGRYGEEAVPYANPKPSKNWKVVKEVEGRKQDDEGNYSVAYGNMVGLLIEAIKELKAEVDELKSRL